MQSDNIGELVKALALAQASFKPITRDAENPFFKSKYATLDTVLDATQTALGSHGLVVVQTTNGDTLITVLAHESGQWIRGELPLHAVKQDPAGIGSAITYARRYAYSAIIGAAPADADDDGSSHSQEAEKQKAEPTKPKAEPKPPVDRLTDAERDLVIDALEKATNRNLNEMGEIIKGALGVMKKREFWTKADAEKIEAAIVKYNNQTEKGLL